MSKQTDDLETYLTIVKTELGDHPDAEDIIHELRTHVWDVADGIAAKTGSSVEDSFIMALEQMEEPQVLAKKFQIEQVPHTKMWTEPKSDLPERKITNQEFILLAIIGFFVATIILSIILWVDQLTDTKLDPFNFIVGLVQVAILIALIIGFLYYRDEKVFKNQVQKLRNKFSKTKEKEDDAPASEIEQSKKKKDDCSSDEICEIYGVHILGLLKVIFGFLIILGALYVTFIAQWELFTDNWFSIGLIVFIFLQIIDIIEGMIRMVIGEIRISRLICSIVEMFHFMGTVILVIFYPFDIAGWFETINDPTARSIVDAINNVISRPDHTFRIVMGVLAVFILMSALSNAAKFEEWKPSQHRSLTISSDQPVEES